MLIFGWRTRASAKGHGIFACPSCGSDRNYTHKCVRSWFTLFFIPLIPMKVRGEYVECDTCKHTYNMSVLTMPTTATLQEHLLGAMRESLVTLLRVSSTPSSEDAARRALSSFVDREWTSDELAADIAGLDTSSLMDRLAKLAAVLNEQGKERFLATCAGVAATGSTIDPESRAVLDQIAGGLTMTAAHARGVIDEVVETHSA